MPSLELCYGTFINSLVADDTDFFGRILFALHKPRQFTRKTLDARFASDHKDAISWHRSFEISLRAFIGEGHGFSGLASRPAFDMSRLELRRCRNMNLGA